MMEANDEENARIKKQLENELNSTQDLIKRKLSYDDTRYQEYNKYNIPPLPRSLKVIYLFNHYFYYHYFNYYNY